MPRPSTGRGTQAEAYPLGIPLQGLFRVRSLRSAPTNAEQVLLLAVVWAGAAAAAEPGERPRDEANTAAAARPARAFILGADISSVPQQEDEGIRFSDHGVEKDVLAILKDHGFNGIRSRIFHDPTVKNGYSKKGYCDLAHTVRMAKRIRAAGMGFLLDFHCADTWADPGHQPKPAAWAALGSADLQKALHDHTRDVVAELKKQGAAPDMVQVGNEISHGFLWPEPKKYRLEWDEFCGLLRAGIAGVREADPSVKIMLHLACGGQNAESRWFLDNVVARKVDFDVIGQSYYPRWHGTLDDLKGNLTDLAARYGRAIVVVEYSVTGTDVRKLNDIVRGLPKGRGLGTFIWEPTKWEGPALFEQDGRTKAAIGVYRQMAGDYGNENGR